MYTIWEPSLPSGLRTVHSGIVFAEFLIRAAGIFLLAALFLRISANALVWQGKKMPMIPIREKDIAAIVSMLGNIVNRPFIGYTQWPSHDSNPLAPLSPHAAV